MSRLLGEKKESFASEVAASAFYFALAIGVLIAACGLLFLDPLITLLGATETIRPYAVEYAQYILYAAPFLITSLTLNKMLCAEGKARFAMVGIAFGGVLNIFLDPLFIFVFHMGIAGAGNSDSAQSGSKLLYSSLYVCKRQDDREAESAGRRPHMAPLRSDRSVRNAFVLPSGACQCGDDCAE